MTSRRSGDRLRQFAANIAEGHGRENTRLLHSVSCASSQGSLKELGNASCCCRSASGCSTSKQMRSSRWSSATTLGKMTRSLIRSLQRRQSNDDRCSPLIYSPFAIRYSLHSHGRAMTDTRHAQLHHQLRAAASGGARRAAPGAGTRRRDRRARRSAYRPAASRHREADRAEDLSAGDPVFRPARLRRADEPGARVLPRGGKAARPAGAAPRATDPRALLRDRAAAVAPPQRHHAGDGRRRAHPAAVGLRGAREADGVLRARLRLAHACGLFPRRRRASGPAAEADRRHRGVLRSVPEGLRRSRNAAHRQPHLQAAQRRHRRGLARGRLEVGLLRRDGARLGRRLGPAQVAALRVLRRDGFRHSDRQERRLLRPLLHPHGGDAPVDRAS